MAGAADPADTDPPRNILSFATAAVCVAVAYVFVGAPGLSATPLGAVLPRVDPAQGWLPAVHLLASAVALSGGAWLTGVLRQMARPGALPLVFFAVFQFALLFCALANLALAAGAFRIGGLDGAMGLFLVFPGLAALRLHAELYMSVLRLQSWVSSIHLSERGPATGGALIALTVASNLVPLALCFQAITTHSGMVLASLFRRAAADPGLYGQAIWSQITSVSPQEGWMALAAAGTSILLGVFWALSRASDVRRVTQSNKAAALLSPAQLRFVEDALPAAVHAVQARASSSRFVSWSLFWMLAVTPALLTAAYSAAMWFGVLQEQHALSWTANAASDLTPFATGETGFAQIVIPAALILFVLTMSAPVADLLLKGARYDRAAFGQALDAALRAKLVAATRSGANGPGQAFDAEHFADLSTRSRYWIRIPLAISAIGIAAAVGFFEVARGVAFTGDGAIVQDHFFAPPKLVRYTEVQAVALDCRVGPLGAKPVYALTLPGGRVVDIVGSAPLNERIDQYIAVDRRLQFSGVGYAYPPGDLEPCLKAIQGQYNSVIAAGAARLLHVVD
jgi:hypothetical protein